MTKLNIFVSSTCYDLSQIRADLQNAISELGYNPVLSEFADFPINPTSSTLENCIDAINSSADIFILIIGNRYGFKLDSGKSITNMEFLTAKKKGIPIYVFINKQLLSLLPIYQVNKNADYSNVVDNTQVFEFANEIRNSSGLWSYEFEKFQNIIIILKTQLSYLFKDSLSIRNKFYLAKNNEFYSKLSSKSLNIIFSKDEIYEYEYLAQVFIDEIEKFETLKKDYDYKIVLKASRRLFNDKDFVGWISDQLSTSKAYIPALTNLINVLIPKYLGELGKPSDLKGLYYSANTYARLCSSMINWTIDILSTDVEENQIELRNIIAEMMEWSIEQVWDFPYKIHKRILDAKNRIKMGEDNLVIKMDLVVEVNPKVTERFNIALQDFVQHSKK